MRTLLTLVWAGAAVAQQIPPPTLSENTTRVSDHVQIISGFPNIAIVIGDQATLVVDTGLGPANGATVARVARKLSKGEKLYLTTTHFHPEHAAGEAGFPPETILIRPAVQQQEMVENGPALLERFKGLNPAYGVALKDVTKQRTPDITFDNELKLDLGGATVRLLWFGVAHTKGDEAILVDPDRTLITGDLVQNKVVPAVSAADGSLKSWVQVLNKLDALKPLRIVPDHSRVGDGSLIAQERAFIQDMSARALALKKQGVSAADAGKQLTDVFKSAYPEWAANPDWPNVNGINGFVQRVYTEDK
jgi:glyoxylase-like metal-dependent hydrolase (beta-lactamase superfamily II)